MNPDPSPGKCGSRQLLRELAGQRETKRHRRHGVETVVEPVARRFPL